jgi:hypothetical protein
MNTFSLRPRRNGFSRCHRDDVIRSEATLDTSWPQSVDVKNKVVLHSGGKLRKAMKHLVVQLG